METLDSDKPKDFDLDPEMMLGSGLDQNMTDDCGLDLTKTMDFALFQNVCCELFPYRSQESIARFVKRKESERFPSLCVVLYKDLVKTAWGWDRLLPWMSGYVLFEDYFRYLRRYFLENARCITELHTAATECVDAENELRTTIGAPGGLITIGNDHFELSKRINAKANDLINVPTDPDHDTIPVACFMCITEEAKLMSEVFTKWTAEADKGSAKLWQKKFEFSNEVRKAAFDILTTYRGPYFSQVSAPLLGMKREAAVAFELLRGHDVDSEEAYICEEIREFTLKLLRSICKRFPQDSAIEYCPIDRARAIMRKKHTKHLAEPSKDFVSADEDNINGTAILNSPITSKSTVRAAPSSWESYPEKNYKIKFYGKLNEKSTGSYKCGIELNTMEDCGIDPETMEDCGLDLNKTMDFALFQGVCCRLVFPSRSHESMERLIKWKESEDIKRLPPLSVVLYNDLVKTAWGWDRLLPWMTGYVLFEDYFCYLEQYFKENASCITKHHTAATDCLAAENELSTSIGAHGGLIDIGDDHFELSKRIKAKANDLINAPTYPAHDTVRVACFMCITEEAKVMSEVFTKWTAEAHKGSAEFWQKEFEFSNEVRKAAFEILTTYRGPYSGQVSAPLLGMKREAAVAFELLRGHDVDSEEAYICEEIREFTLELLRIICKRFPKDSAIEYFPIDHARAIMRKKHTELLAEPSKDFVSADEDNINGTAILNSPITSKSTVRAAPSSWSEQDNINNKKMKSMGLFQDTIMPNIQSPDPEKHSGAADKFGVPNLVTALETSVPSAPRKSYPEKNYKIKFYGKLKEKPTGSYKCGIELNTMEYCGIDPETMEDCCLDRAIMRKKHTEHLAESSKDIVSADEVSPDNIDGIAIPNSPITSVSPVLAVPSSWSEQDNMNNKKMKSMRLSQDNDTPSTQSVDLGKYNGTADSSLTPVTVFGHLHSLNTKAVSRSTENADDKK